MYNNDVAVTRNLLTAPLPISFIPEILIISLRATTFHLDELAVLYPQALGYSSETSTRNDTL
jgi:hypothetical protein